MEKTGSLKRVPVSAAGQAPMKDLPDYLDLQTIANGTVYIRISDLFYLHSERIARFLDENKSLMTNSKQLIIDLRDNPGGMYWPLEKLVPLLYTRPILDPGGEILASEDNIEACSRLVLRGESHWQSKLYSTPQALLDSMKAHKNQLVAESLNDTTRLNRMLPNPQKIAFLVNANTMSAAEMFLTRASQSDKVTVFGKPTKGGALSGGIATIALPCSLLKLSYPMIRSNTIVNSVSKEGKIIPHVLISDQTEDWITFVLDYWQRH